MVVPKAHEGELNGTFPSILFQLARESILLVKWHERITSLILSYYIMKIDKVFSDKLHKPIFLLAEFAFLHFNIFEFNNNKNNNNNNNNNNNCIDLTKFRLLSSILISDQWGTILKTYRKLLCFESLS
ncbi:hypothetical protein H8356DRAFT_1433803 [Neocallimastix lanati (nom. inval.)]|nr:hypothetical protein H8356DRAFT_1433803 [Neocallimastix sp. JGI-2020a]